MEFRYKHNPHLDRLSRILHFDLDKKAPTGSYLFLDTLSYAGIVMAIISTPVVLWLLFKLKRYGWLITLLVLILVPYCAGYFFVDNPVFRYTLMVTPLAFAIVFYLFLKMKIEDWREPVFTYTPDSDFQ